MAKTPSKKSAKKAAGKAKKDGKKRSKKRSESVSVVFFLNIYIYTIQARKVFKKLIFKNSVQKLHSRSVETSPP